MKVQVSIWAKHAVKNGRSVLLSRHMHTAKHALLGLKKEVDQLLAEGRLRDRADITDIEVTVGPPRS